MERRTAAAGGDVAVAVAAAAAAALPAEGGDGKTCLDLQRRRMRQVLAEEEDGIRLREGGKVGVAAVVGPRLPVLRALVRGPL